MWLLSVLGISVTKLSTVQALPCNNVPLPTRAVQVQYGRDSGKLMRTAKGASQRYTQQYSNASYTSGFLHHVKLDHLLPSTTYYYR